MAGRLSTPRAKAMAGGLVGLVGLAVVAVAVSLGGPGADPSPSPSPSPTAAATASPTPSPRPSPSPSPSATASPSPTGPPAGIADLTGLRVDPAVAHRLPIAVMIDDNRIARPESGFNGADIVFHALADGFESRYMFVYASGESAAVGPVRSGRPYFIHWAEEWRASIAHFGGDLATQHYVAANHGRTMTSIDGTGRGGFAYHRIASRQAPHNAYTSTETLRTAAIRLGAPESLPDSIRRWPFIAPDPSAAADRKQTIRVPYRTNVIDYAWDGASGRYLRSVDGAAQIDPADGRRVGPTNVVVLFMSFRLDTQIEPGHSRPVIGLVGSGKALVFREGTVVEGTWAKADLTAPTTLRDAAGNDLPLIAGQTFIQVVPIGTRIDVGP